MGFDTRRFVPTIGITHESNGFKYCSDDPWDWNAEFESTVAVGDITNAIGDAGFPTVFIGNAAKLLDDLAAYREKVQIIFNIPGGKIGGSTGVPVAGLLESCGIAHVGSDAETLAIAANKALARINMEAGNIRMPEHFVISDTDDIRGDAVTEYPVILKRSHGWRGIPTHERVKIRDFGQLKRHAAYMLRTYGEDIMVERFIEGREFEVTMLGTRPSNAFGIAEVTLNGGPMGGNHITPRIAYNDDYGFCLADADDGLSDVADMALSAYDSLRCRDYGSADIRVEESTGRPYLLEINPRPYLGPSGSFGHAAGRRGMTHGDVMGAILGGALERHGQ